jgi:hypothetical protein
MGYKILDVKADIHEDVEKYFATLLSDLPMADFEYVRGIEVDLLDIVDKHFERIER